MKKNSVIVNVSVRSDVATSVTVNTTVTSCVDAEPWLGTVELGVPSASTLSSQSCIDSNDNIYFSGNTGGGLNGNTLNGNQDAFITKIDKTGTALWTQLLGSHGATLSTNGCDTSGNSLVICGNVYGAALPGNTKTGTSDYFLAKYDLSGARAWVKQLGSVGQSAYARAVKIADSGNIYICGHTGGGLNGNTMNGVRDMFIARYDTNGSLIWLKQLGVSAKLTYGINLAIDSNENCFIVGYTTGGLDGNTLTGTTDAFISKCDNNGNIVWTKQQGVTGVLTRAMGIAVDSAGNAVVGGETRGGMYGNTLKGVMDLTITKYDTNGNLVFFVQRGSPSVTTGYPMVGLDSQGNIILTTYADGGFDGQVLRGVQDINTLKFDASGNHIWTRLLGAMDGVSNTTGISIDSSDNIFVPGNATVGLDGNTLIGTLDSVLLKYTACGNLVR